jgi:hypothetical protein
MTEITQNKTDANSEAECFPMLYIGFSPAGSLGLGIDRQQRTI